MKRLPPARILLLSTALLTATLSGCSLTEVRTPVTTAEASETKTERVAEPNYLRHSAKDITGKEVALDAYKGDVVLVVNTASNCGFTGQYKDLQELHQRYEKKGLRVLGFPCNDFGDKNRAQARKSPNFVLRSMT